MHQQFHKAPRQEIKSGDLYVIAKPLFQLGEVVEYYLNFPKGKTRVQGRIHGRSYWEEEGYQGTWDYALSLKGNPVPDYPDLGEDFVNEESLKLALASKNHEQHCHILILKY